MLPFFRRMVYGAEGEAQPVGAPPAVAPIVAPMVAPPIAAPIVAPVVAARVVAVPVVVAPPVANPPIGVAQFDQHNNGIQNNGMRRVPPLPFRLLGTPRQRQRQINDPRFFAIASPRENERARREIQNHPKRHLANVARDIGRLENSIYEPVLQLALLNVHWSHLPVIHLRDVVGAIVDEDCVFQPRFRHLELHHCILVLSKISEEKQKTDGRYHPCYYEKTRTQNTLRELNLQHGEDIFHTRSNKRNRPNPGR